MSCGQVRIPLVRPLFMYSTASIMNEKPQVAAFLNYVLNNVNDLICGLLLIW
jgi:ABC-type phosphate transport system substrate-binding protein